MTAGKTDNAAAILNYIRKDIIRTMQQKGRKDEAENGMDISLYIIERNIGQLGMALSQGNKEISSTLVELMKFIN